MAIAGTLARRQAAMSHHAADVLGRLILYRIRQLTD